jgi:hypothetical protein
MHVISSLSCLIIIYENVLRLVKLVNCWKLDVAVDVYKWIA